MGDIEIKKMLIEQIPLVLSAVVSLFAVFSAIYQSSVSKQTKVDQWYFDAQLKAYQELFRAAADQECDPPEGEERDVRPLIYAGLNAMLVSTPRNSEIINHFCAVYLDYVIAGDDGELTDSLTDEFKETRKTLIAMLQDELLRFTSSKRKSDKYFKQRKRKSQNED